MEFKPTLALVSPVPKAQQRQNGFGMTYFTVWSHFSNLCDGASQPCSLRAVTRSLFPCDTDCWLRTDGANTSTAAGMILLMNFFGRQHGATLPRIQRGQVLYCIDTEPVARTARRQKCAHPASVLVSTLPDAPIRFSWLSRFYMSPDELLSATAMPLAERRAHDFANGMPQVSAFFGHCDSQNGNRMDLLKRLQGYGLTIASYGECGRNVGQEAIRVASNGTFGKLELLRRHPFALVAENSPQPGWVTEKLYQAFQAGVVPVWLGTGKRWVEMHLLPVIPPQSVVVAADFPSELALVQFLLRASRNASQYRRFHSWRRNRRAASLSTLQRVYDASLDSVLCRVCRHLRETTKSTI